jgi:CO/xanthine dehydrogenase FAD-binding subunit
LKPPPFAYRRVDSIEAAVALLADESNDAKVLAGGQSLVPMLNLRLANPGMLVDVGGLSLRSVEMVDGHVQLGALVTHRTLETDPTVAAELPLFALVAPQIGHVAIRNRGTVGGSLAHADPAAELAMAALALDASIVAQSSRGTRTIPIGEFLDGPFMTTLAPDEMVIRVDVPRHGDRSVGFNEVAIRAGDFAVVAAATVARRAPDGTLSDVRIALGGVSATAIRAPEAEAVLEGVQPDADRLRHAASLAAEAADPSSDVHGTAEYRRSLIVPVVERAFASAMNGGNSPNGGLR